jgi:hypothetical protein
MRENYFIIGISYCLAQNLLAYENPIAYSVGAYGWACDYYLVDNVIISTGYSPLENKNTKTDYEMIKSYDNKALLIMSSSGADYDQKRNALKLLLSEFVQQAKDNAKGVK